MRWWMLTKLTVVIILQYRDKSFYCIPKTNLMSYVNYSYNFLKTFHIIAPYTVLNALCLIYGEKWLIEDGTGQPIEK